MRVGGKLALTLPALAGADQNPGLGKFTVTAQVDAIGPKGVTLTVEELALCFALH